MKFTAPEPIKIEVLITLEERRLQALSNMFNGRGLAMPTRVNRPLPVGMWRESMSLSSMPSLSERFPVGGVA